MARLKNLIKDYVNKFGLYKTSKMLGISNTDVVELGDIQIDEIVAYDILSEGLRDKKIRSTYKEFVISVDKWEGTFIWFSSIIRTGYFLPDYTEIISAYATPYWDGEDITPVDITWFKLMDENGIRTLSQEITDVGDAFFNPISFENTKELFAWYEEEYLPKVYNTIMNKLLPQTHQIIDDLMDEKNII